MNATVRYYRLQLLAVTEIDCDTVKMTDEGDLLSVTTHDVYFLNSGGCYFSQFLNGTPRIPQI